MSRGRSTRSSRARPSRAGSTSRHATEWRGGRATCGPLFPLSLIVTVDHAATPADAASLTGFVHGVGYLIARLFPFAAGGVRQHLADLTPAWVAMACLCAVLFALAAGFAPRFARHVARA